MNHIKTLKSRVLAGKRFFSHVNSQDVLKHRARLFEEEHHRQLRAVERTEKIQVHVEEPGQNCTLIMNRHLSTPYSCALHISEMVSNRSALAKVNNKIWDMHRPLENNSQLKFLHFKDIEPHELNLAYWRSCAFILGYVLENSFKENIYVELISPTNPHIKSGSFSYDSKLNLGDWKPTKSELRCLSIGATQLIKKNLKFERLNVTLDVARNIFQYNKYKLNHLDNIAQSLKNENPLRKNVTIYKLGEFVDLADGPMISNTSLIGRFNLTNIFNIESSKYGVIQRTQAVSIPSQLQLHSWTYDLLVERAAFPLINKPTSDEIANNSKNVAASVQAL